MVRCFIHNTIQGIHCLVLCIFKNRARNGTNFYCLYTGPLLGFQNCGCGFSYFLKNPKIKGTFVQKSRVKNQISSKSVGAKSVFLKICGCSCTHCTHTTEVLGKHAAILSLVPLGKHTYEESIP